MKALILLLLFSLTAVTGAETTHDKNYKNMLNVINKALMISAEKGYHTALIASNGCFLYITGLNHGRLLHKDFKMSSSKEYQNWDKKQRELNDKTIYFARIKAYQWASYYAIQNYKLTCRYSRDLLNTIDET